MLLDLQTFVFITGMRNSKGTMHTACGSGVKGGGGTQNSHNNLILMQSKRNYHLAYGNQPVGGSIVAVVGQQVIVEFPEHMECYAAVWCRHIVVSFP